MRLGCRVCDHLLGTAVGGRLFMRHRGRLVVIGEQPVIILCERCGTANGGSAEQQAEVVAYARAQGWTVKPRRRAGGAPDTTTPPTLRSQVAAIVGLG